VSSKLVCGTAWRGPSANDTMSLPTTLRVLQITDPHMTARAGEEIHGNDPYRALTRVLDAALADPSPPELLIATGDLSADESPASYERMRELLLRTGLPCLVLPGNHDSAEEMRRSLVGGLIQSSRVHDFPDWRFVLLDSTVEGEYFGRLEASELAALTDALESAGRRRVVVALHHGPLRPCPSPDCHLRNGDELMERLRSSPAARVVLAGHAHLELEQQLDHVLCLTCPSSNSQAIHAQLGAPVDHDDFYASHTLDPSRHAYRMLSLGPGDAVHTEVIYLNALEEIA